MRGQIVILLGTLMLFIASSAKSQCPPRDVLRKRMAYLRETSTISTTEKLAELESYLAKINGCPYRNDSTHASLMMLMGGLYNQKGNYLEAVRYRKQAIHIITTNADKPSVNVKTLPGIYYWLSLAYDSLGNYSEKMKALDSCATIAMRLNYADRASLMAVYTFLEHFFDVGDYQRCIDYASRCQALARQYALNNTAAEQKVAETYVSSSFGWQVIALMKLKKFVQAEELLANKITEYKKAGLLNYLGTTFSQLAEVQVNKGDYEKALAFYNQALKYDLKAGYYFNCRQTLKDIGYQIYFSHYNNTAEAMAYYKKAVALINKDQSLATADAFETLDIFTKIANVYVQKQQYDSAFHFFQLAFNQVKPGVDEKTILKNSSEEIFGYKKIHYLTRLLLDKGNAFLNQYKSTNQKVALENAIGVFKVTDQFLDRLRIEQKDPQSKLFWRGDSRRLYENAIEACHLSANTKDAFYFFEKSRAILLSDQLSEQRWQGRNDILQQTQLKKKIVLLEREFANTLKSSPRYAQLQTELFDKKQQLDRTEQAIRTNNPLYYQNFLDENFVSLQEVRNKVLNDHQALIELFAGDGAVYALFIRSAGIELKKINKIKFDSLSHLYVNYISNSALLNKNFYGFIETSSQFYQLLFQNVDLPKGRIVVSLDGQYFPFEALVTSHAAQPISYFITDYAVSYTYSARYLTNQFSNASVPRSSLFMGIAPVQYASRLGLPSLSGSDHSLRRLHNWFSDENNLVAEDASRNNFLKEFYKHKIVQLYTHATDSGYNGEPTIYFRDSALLLSDLVYENKPATSLIVLSACETGTGKLYQGEGVFSFNRGFAALGIPSSVTNLWQVDNESSYRLTELFYKWLVKGLPADVALQKAKTEFINISGKEKQLPYYWAGPVLVGQSGIIEIPQRFLWRWLAGAIVVLTIFFWGWKQWTRKRDSYPKGPLNKSWPQKSRNPIPGNL